MQKSVIMETIRETARLVLPEGAKVLLFGSQARGDARADSDWDVLVLLNKDKIGLSDHDQYAYPFFELGWRIDVQIHPMLYTQSDWLSRSSSLFYKNVEQDAVELC